MAATQRRLGRLAMPVLAGWLAGGGLAWGQGAYRPYDASKRRTAGGREFPSWERDVDASERDPLPWAPTGSHAPTLGVDLGGPPAGVSATADGRLVVALRDGRVQVRSAKGDLAWEVDVGAELTAEPLATAGAIVVAGPRVVASVTEGAVTWAVPLDAPLRLRPAAIPEGIVVAHADGRVQLLDARRGAARWTATAPGVVTAGPSAGGSPRAVVMGTDDGTLFGLTLDRDEVAWQLDLGDRVHALTADAASVWVSAHGKSGRTRRDTGPIVARVALPSERDSAPRLRWRARVGSASDMPPLPLGEAVLFAAHGGFVEAREPGSGRLRWRTDLPARPRSAPVVRGGRIEFALEATGHVVTLARTNGAIMGWSRLKDPDEELVGPAASAGTTLACATNFGRLVGWTWSYDEASPEGEGGARSAGEGSAGRPSRVTAAGGPGITPP